MSMTRLAIEQELRAIEEETRAQDELRLAKIRHEATLPEPRSRKVIPLLVADPYAACAERLERWFRLRKNRPVSRSEVGRLAAILRRLGRKS